MKVIIWGAGKGCKKALTVCDAFEWEIVSIVDSDFQKIGKEVGNYRIQSPDTLKHIDRETYIMIASANDEIVELAQNVTERIIDWNVLSTLYKGAARYPDYQTKNLEDDNIKNCILLKDRETLLKELSKHYSTQFNFAEVGVAYGDFSKEILINCKPSKLYLIDAWEGERYGKGLKMVEEKLNSEIKNGIVEIKKGYSFTVLQKFEDNFLDIVYIDTEHTYEATWSELLICMNKVKPDGFICGHDYTKYNTYSRMDYGVYDAVNRFCVEYNYEMCYLTMEKDGCHSFALRKIV